MPKKPAKKQLVKMEKQALDYDSTLAAMIALIETGHRTAARAVNSVMTAIYWEMGRYIIELEQGGQKRAGYGKELLKKLATDLSQRFRRGFGVDNLERMRSFYSTWPPQKISATLSRKSPNRLSDPFDLADLAQAFPLPWSHYVRLLSVRKETAREFYEAEALRGGWSVRQLDRQIGTQFYERTLLSRNKAAMLNQGQKPRPADYVSPEEEIKDPLVLEFLNLKDEYSESDLEAALLQHIEPFLLELGNDFTFVGRQKRLRIGDQWFRIDLVFFHRRLRCLLLLDLKLGEFTLADAGQMHLYLNYARENWTHADENPPVDLILCESKNEAVAHYALDGLPNKVVAAEYRTLLPDEQLLQAELQRTSRLLKGRIKVKARK